MPTLEVPSPATPDQPVVPETPSVPADPTPDRETPATPTGPTAPEPDDPLPPQPEGPDVPSTDPGGPETGESGGDALDHRRALALVDEGEHRFLDRPLMDHRVVGGLGGAHDVDHQPAAIGVEHARIDVGRTADRRRVAEVVRDLLDRAPHRALAAGLGGRDLPRHGERHRTQHGRAPGAEVLGREVVAGRVLEVGVDVLRAHVVPRPAALVGEQLLAAAAAAAQPRHDRERAGVHDALHAPLAGLGGVVEDHHSALLDPHVLLAHRGEPVGLVLDRGPLGADAEEPAVEQPHRAGQHALPRQPVARVEIRRHPLAQVRQRGREAHHVVEFLLVAPPPPVVVVAVLLAAGVIDAGRLEVPVRVRADPHVAPRGRDRQLADARERLGIADALVALVVGKAAPPLDAGDPRTGAVGAAQAGHARVSPAPPPISPYFLAPAFSRAPRLALFFGLGSSPSEPVTAARLASRAAMRSGTLVGCGASGCTAISSPAALRSISSRTFSRYSSRYFPGSHSVDSESISCWAILSSRAEALSSFASGRSSIESCETTSSAKIIVSMHSRSSCGRIATSCSLERSTTLAIATFPDSCIALSSRP